MTSEFKIEIIVERCKGCGVCIAICQRNVLEEANGKNKNEHHPPIVKNAQQCTGCGMCEMFCPDFAIFVVSQKKRKWAYE